MARSAPGSSAARQRVVFGFGDVLAPGRALALLSGLRQRQMREQALGRGAVPVQRVGRDVDRVARVQHLRLLAFEANATDAGETEQGLPNRVRMPSRPRAR